MRLGSLCTGYGGLDLAAEHVLGPLHHTWHAEIDPHASKVLAHHWPTTPNLGDLTTVDWTTVPQVDVLTAGFPCQDVSCAGKRAGLVADHWELPDDVGEMDCGCFPMNHKVWCEQMSPLGWAPAGGGDEARSIAAAQALNERDKAAHPEWIVRGTRTGVWSYVADAIKHLRPKIVLLENVRGLLSARADSDVEPCPWCLGDTSTEPVVRALGAVLGDLADLGFDAEWTTVAASDVGAPHRRERVFIAAWPSDSPPDAGELAGRVGVGAAAADGVTLLPTPRASDTGTPGRRASEGFRPPLSEVLLTQLLPTPTSRDHKGHNQRHDTTCLTGALLPTPNATDWKGGSTRLTHARGNPTLLGALLPTPRATDGTKGDPNQRGSSGDLMLPSAVVQLLPTPMAADGGSDRASSAGFGLRDASRTIPDRWGNYAPAITRWEAVTGRQAPSPTEPGKNGQPRLAPPFVEWLMGLPAGWVTDHLGRGPALKALGNGVVWQQAAHAYTELLAAA